MKKYAELVRQQVRVGGVLLHPTSLPSGKLDKDVFRWLDLIASAGLGVWQVLPLGVPQDNLSPYQCYSAFAMNPVLLDENEYANPDLNGQAFHHWCEKECSWLDDYALFMVLKDHFAQNSWCDWPSGYRKRDPEVLKRASSEYRSRINAIRWQQFCLYRRWEEVCEYAHQRNILLFGDMPIFVAHDSADVWTHPNSFLLDDHGRPAVVAGVPPDYFSETGQRWGNPHYNWDFMLRNDFSWWLDRLHNHLELFDLVRIDHFRGLEAVWVIDADCETAVDGYWKKTPGDKLLQRLRNDLGQIPIVAEDLGIITPEVNALREQFGLPGMSVLQFSFDAFGDNPHKPQNIGYDRVVYTGTHDNDTTVGWFNSLDEQTQQFVMQTLDIDNADQVVDSIIDSAFVSAGQLAIVPLQDLLHLGSDARMNMPGVSDGNWRWQFRWRDIPANLAAKTRLRLQKAGRLTSIKNGDKA